MTVRLDYFNPDSGEWYSNGFYTTEMTALHQVLAEVKWLMQRKELPNLVAGHAVYTVLVTYGDVPKMLLYGRSVP